MSRNIFSVALCTLLFALSFPAEAQQAGKIAKIGYFAPGSPTTGAHLLKAFRQGLQELGYVEGKTFVLEVRYGETRGERLPELARELVGLKLDVIVAATDGVIAAVKRETQTIPIVMRNSSDPVGTGLVASLARPGGNFTGLSSMSPELSGKRLELLKEVVPGLSRVAFLWNPDVRGAVLDYKETEGAARSLGLELQSIEVSRAEDLDRAFSAVTNQRAQALVLPGGTIVFTRRGQIASFAQRNRLPSMSAQNEYVDAGGLMSYGPNLFKLWRDAAMYFDKIFKGTKPEDIPIELPSTLELIINLKSAKTIGLAIPQSVLARADQIIA